METNIVQSDLRLKYLSQINDISQISDIFPADHFIVKQYIGKSHINDISQINDTFTADRKYR